MAHREFHTPDTASLDGVDLAGLKRFFAPLEAPIRSFPAELTVTDDFVVRHLGTVMRAKPGEMVIITDESRETVYIAQIQGLQKKSVVFTVQSQLPQGEDPLPHTTLAVALIKEQRWDWLLQKATELGVRSIQPLFSERCIIRLSASDIPKKLERWGGVLRSAAEQSEGLFIPAILPPLPLTPFLSQSAASGANALKLVLMERGENRLTLKNKLAQAQSGQPIILAVGPEGGWTEAEKASFTQAGFEPVSIGQRILRSETAAIAAMSAIVATFDA
jgi:16S rRNA (uracil1498-N3)-methyltransferase